MISGPAETKNENVISVRNISKTFKTKFLGGHIHALREVSLDVPRGAIFGLLGPNGAGKTTLIKILLGIIRHIEGSAELLGYKAGDKRSRRRIGYLPEHLRLPHHQTARTALEYYGRLSGMSYPQIRARRPEVLRIVGLEGRDRESVKRFSKGMQQRLGLAQALMHDPDLLFLDEPTDGLDPVGRSQVREIMRRLQEEGRTVFVNSHLLQEVELVCDRVAILDHGTVRFVGRLEDLTPHDDPTLVITVVGAAEQIDAAVQELGDCEVQQNKTETTLRIKVHDQASADRVVDVLRKHQIGILRLQRHRRTLEDAFLELISTEAELA